MSDLTVGRVEFGPPGSIDLPLAGGFPPEWVAPLKSRDLGLRVQPLDQHPAKGNCCDYYEREAFFTAFIVGLQLGLDLILGTYETASARRTQAEEAYAEWQAFRQQRPIDPDAWAEARRQAKPEPAPEQEVRVTPLAPQPAAPIRSGPREPKLFPTVEILAGCHRIDIVGYRRRPNLGLTGGGWAVDFNGEFVGYCRRSKHSAALWLTYLPGDELLRTSRHRTRGEAAGALIRAQHPDWQGTAP